MITDELEIVGRWSHVMPLRLTSVQEGWEAGAGISWYVVGQDLKLQADYFRLGGPNHGPGQNQLRFQLQLFL
jgi:hypothetical protein